MNRLCDTSSFNVYDSVDESEEEILFQIIMEDLSQEYDKEKLQMLMQYRVELPFRVAVVGQTDSGKTHSIIRRWVGGKISFWKYIDDELRSCQLQHCLYCSNGGMPNEEKRQLKEEFVNENRVEEQL